MYLLIVIFGAYHGLIFLPAALSLFGPAERKAHYGMSNSMFHCVLNVHIS